MKNTIDTDKAAYLATSLIVGTENHSYLLFYFIFEL